MHHKVQNFVSGIKFEAHLLSETTCLQSLGNLCKVYGFSPSLQSKDGQEYKTGKQHEILYFVPGSRTENGKDPSAMAETSEPDADDRRETVVSKGDDELKANARCPGGHKLLNTVKEHKAARGESRLVETPNLWPAKPGQGLVAFKPSRCKPCFACIFFTRFTLSAHMSCSRCKRLKAQCQSNELSVPNALPKSYGGNPRVQANVVTTDTLVRNLFDMLDGLAKKGFIDR